MPQNLTPFNQLPTLSTNNEPIRLPPIQTLTQYCCPPKPTQPVPFIPVFPPSNNSQAITHVSRNISPPITTSFVFHQVNPTHVFPPSSTPVPTFQHSKYNSMNENHQQPILKKVNSNNLTFVNMDLSTNKKSKSTNNNYSAGNNSIGNTFQVSNVGSSSCNFRTPLFVNNVTPMQNNLNAVSNALPTTFIQQPSQQIETSIRRKNKKQAQESSSNSCMHSENSQEESFRTTSNRNLPKQAVSIMKEWLFSHKENPYPTEEEKLQIQNQTGLSQKRINYWFINARRRLLPTNENKKRTTSNNFSSSSDADTKRLRKNSIVSSSSNASNYSMVSSYSTVSSSVSSVSSSEMDEISHSSDGSDVKVVDSWVVDCLLTLNK